MNSLPNTVTRQRRGCDLPSASESSTLTTRVHTVDAFVGGEKESVELGATPGGRLLHEPVGHLLIAGAPAGALSRQVVDDVGETADVAEVGAQTAA